MVKYYLIANIVIKIISPFEFKISNDEQYHIEPQKEDFTFEFIPTTSIPALMEGSTYIQNVRWAHEFKKIDGTFQRAFLYQEQYYNAVTEIKPLKGICYYVGEELLLERLEEGFELFSYLCIEEILLQFNAVVLHSSQVVYNHQAFVFSAPSQTGKSTQASLWETYKGATVINGDRSILKKENNKWHVYGSPMNGTSGISLQNNMELSHIIMLEKGLENQLQRLPLFPAFQQVYPQITVPTWDGRLTNLTMDLINDLIINVPVWFYSCTKERDAVEILQQALGL